MNRRILILEEKPPAKVADFVRRMKMEVITMEPGEGPLILALGPNAHNYFVANRNENVQRITSRTWIWFPPEKKSRRYRRELNRRKR